MLSRPMAPGSAGFTLVELMLTLVLLSLLLGLALPSWRDHVLRSRRTDAITTLAQLQQAQERWRAEHPRYANSLAPTELNWSSTSPAGHYTLSTEVTEASASQAYRVLAQAKGSQLADQLCRWLVVEYDGVTLRYRSGANAALDNDEVNNRACWRA